MQILVFTKKKKIDQHGNFLNTHYMTTCIHKKINKNLFSEFRIFKIPIPRELL